MKIRLLIILVLVSSRFFAQTPVEHLTLDSKYIDETRTLTIALPNGYKNSTKKYPLILVFDQALLFDTTAAIVNQLGTTSRMPESILVAISAGNKHRNYFAPNWYNNHRNRRYNYGNHQEEFVDFLERELLPLVEKNYRTAPFKIFIGFSPSSALGLYTLLNKPNLFQAYICFATSNIIGDGYAKGERLIEELELLYSKQQIGQNYLYVVSGSNDADAQPYITTNIRDFNSKLSKFNSSTIHTKAETIPGEGHTDVILPGLITAFDFIFPKEKWSVEYLDLIENEGAAKDNIASFYQRLSDEYGFEVYPNADRLYSMSCLKNIGRRLLGDKKPEEAIALYNYWVELYPTSHLAHYYLGLSYKEHKENNKAMVAFQRAHQLALLQNSDDVKVYREAIWKLSE